MESTTSDGGIVVSPITDFLETNEIKVRIGRKLRDNITYYNKRVDNDKMVDKEDFVSPYTEVARDVILEILIERDYSIKVEGQYLYLASDNGEPLRGNDKDVISQKISNFVWKEREFEEGKDIFIVPRILPSPDLIFNVGYVKGYYDAYFIGDEPMSHNTMPYYFEINKG